MSDSTDFIEELPREEVLKAAQNLTLWITRNAPLSEREEELPKSFIEKPNENTQEIEQLARLVLLTAASDPENAEAVKSAIAEAGRKELILEGTEIVVLATLGLFALNLLAKGHSSVRRTIKIKEVDGETSFVIEGHFSRGISSSLGQHLKSYFRED